jgi:uncharacterized lipoprotein YmbA
MKTLNQLFILGCVAGILAGCASAPSHFYTLDATAKSDNTTPVSCAVLVGPVFVPAAVERPQFVMTTTANEVQIEEFNRWAAPLNENIARVITLNLGRLLGTPRTATAPMPDFGPAYRITLRIEQFDSVLGSDGKPGCIHLKAQWAIRSPDGKNFYSGGSDASEALKGDSREAFAAAHSAALAKVSCDIAAAIRMAETPKN